MRLIPMHYFVLSTAVAQIAKYYHSSYELIIMNNYRNLKIRYRCSKGVFLNFLIEISKTLN